METQIEVISYQLLPDYILVKYNNGDLEIQKYETDENGEQYFDLSQLQLD